MDAGDARAHLDDRIREIFVGRVWAVAEGIEQMDREEAAYWLGMAMHRKHPQPGSIGTTSPIDIAKGERTPMTNNAGASDSAAVANQGDIEGRMKRRSGVTTC